MLLRVNAYPMANLPSHHPSSLAMSQRTELLFYFLPLLLQYTDPDISSSTYWRSIILLLAAALPLLTAHYLSTPSYMPSLYQNFRVKTFPTSVILISVISNRLDQTEFTASAFISLFLIGFSSNWNHNVLHTLIIIAGHFILLILLSPGFGTFIFILITLILMTTILFDTRHSFSSSEYLLTTTFLSYSIYQAILVPTSPSVILYMIFIAVFLVIPPVVALLEPGLHPILESSAIVTLLSLFCWLLIIFLKNVSYHMSFVRMLTLHTLSEVISHPILILSWVVCVMLSLLFTLYPTSYLPLTVQRKVFHVFINIVYISGIIISPYLLSVASFAVMMLFIMLQILHCKGLEMLSRVVDKFKSRQDEGPLVLSPMFLLIGLSVPVWGSVLTNQQALFLEHDVHEVTRHEHTFLQAMLPLSGVLCVGVGDAAASIIGSTIGRTKINQHKSLEGLCANIASQILFMVMISPYLVWSWRRQMDYILLGFVIVMNGVLEVFTQDIDNLVIPLFVALCVFEMEGCRLLDMIIV